MRFLIPAAAGLALCAGFWGGHAWAHAFLQTAEPAVGSSVQRPPTQVVIDFTEEVEPRFSTFTVQDSHGMRVDKADPHLAGDAAHLAVSLKPLAPGDYTVVWHATATDTHKTQGKFTFTVQAQ